MRKQRRAVLVTLWVGALLGLGAVTAPAPALSLIPDLSIRVTSLPTTVSPPGGLVVYQVKVTNESLIDVLGTFFSSFRVTDTLPSGFSFRAGFSSPSCTGSGRTVNCTGPGLRAGQSTTMFIAAATALQTGSFTNRASITAAALIDLHQSNNTSTATTGVHHSSIGAHHAGISGYFPPGSYTVGTHVLTVPAEAGDTTPGVIGEFSVLEPDSTFCLGHDCKFGEAVRVGFDPVPDYQVTNRANPLRLSLSFEAEHCGSHGPSITHAVGNEGSCDDLRAVKDGETTFIVHPCTGGPGVIGPADTPPCLDELPQVESALVGQHFEVLLLSKDPTFY